MSYLISATKLRAYDRCAYAYYLRYERRFSSPDFFGSATLGTALHQALASFHGEWNGADLVPPMNWIHHCWQEVCSGLAPGQQREGRSLLEAYYNKFVANAPSFPQPLAVEGKIHANIQVESLEFTISGRYDRIDFLEDGLELIDYKSGRDLKIPSPAEMDVQIGLYYLALEQTYQQSLRYLSLLFLRTTEKIQFPAGPEQKSQVEKMIADLALKLRRDNSWEPNPGKQCDRCAYARYCSAVQEQPLPLPNTLINSPELQLTLGLL